MNLAKDLIRGGLHRFGYEIVKQRDLPDATPDERAIDERVKPYTMTSVERVVSLVRAVKYVVANNVEGAVVECGVWKGGSMMAAACALLGSGDTSRDLFLFDTFTGMSEPTEKDRRGDVTAAQLLEEVAGVRCEAGIDEVRRNLLSTGYPPEKLHFVAGKVEDTIPEQAPERIALLRLDTDWYESTLHELTHLYPRLASGGILIIDDYGDWEGARAAVDEYFGGMSPAPFLSRVDRTGRLVVKP